MVLDERMLRIAVAVAIDIHVLLLVSVLPHALAFGRHGHAGYFLSSEGLAVSSVPSSFDLAGAGSRWRLALVISFCSPSASFRAFLSAFSRAFLAFCSALAASRSSWAFFFASALAAAFFSFSFLSLAASRSFCRRRASLSLMRRLEGTASGLLGVSFVLLGTASCLLGVSFVLLETGSVLLGVSFYLGVSSVLLGASFVCLGVAFVCLGSSMAFAASSAFFWARLFDFRSQGFG